MTDLPIPSADASAAVRLANEDHSGASGLDDLRPIIEDALRAAIDNTDFFGDGCPERLRDAIRYSVLAPGKRLRPGLVLMAGEAFGVDPLGEAASKLCPAAVAVEMVHAYSLIHDDLPAMDDDDLRRGRPTTHIEFDEATAILAGDALLTAAFDVLATGLSDATASRAAIKTLSHAAGAMRLVGGQVDDLRAETEVLQQNPDDMSTRDPLQHLESIHRRKTGALISASLQLGADLAIASTGCDAPRSSEGSDQETALCTLSDYASDLGLAFQVVDDLLDATASVADLGKRAGKDADRGKLTYPGLLGVDGARTKATNLVDSAVNHAKLLGGGAWRLQRLARYVLERTH